MNKLLIVCASLSLCFTACRSDDDKSSDPDGGGSAADATPGSSTTIYDVQSETTPEGSSVSLRSVVVTAIDTFGGRTGAIYVQEQAGGAFSGVQLFISGGAPAGIAVGDLVDVDNGVKSEFAYNDGMGGGFDPGYSITQVEAADGAALSVTKVGTGSVPEPEVLNAWDLALDDVEAEKWEGVLIKFEGMRALGDARSVSSSDDTLKDMRITGPYVASSAMAGLDGIGGDCYSSITGVGDYFFNYKITPRSAADIVKDAGGTSCLPPEDSAALCEDNLDNDHDGFDDCSDFSCQESVPACTINTTVVESQNGTIAENTRIRLTDVVVTAVSADNKKFWVQDDSGPGGADDAAAFNGLYVFRGSTQDDLPGNLLGRRVTLVGTTSEFFGLTELSNVAEPFTVGTPGDVDILTGVSVADLSTVKDYEGVLISFPLTNVTVAVAGGCTEDCNFTVAGPLDVSDLIEAHTPGVGCSVSFDGIMHRFSDAIVALPSANFAEDCP
jgi:hypothetical protein